MTIIKSLWDKMRKSMANKIVIGFVIVLILVTWLACFIGYLEFTKELNQTYYDHAEGVAMTSSMMFATAIEDIDQYLADDADPMLVMNEDYSSVQLLFYSLCKDINITYIYVIQVDPDYEHIKFIMSSKNVADENLGQVFDFGYLRETTNDEYKNAYRNIIENDSESEIVVRDVKGLASGAHVTVIVPIFGETENRLLLCVEQPLDSIHRVINNYISHITLGVMILGALAILIYSIYMENFIIRPLSLITNEARDYARGHIHGASNLANKIKNVDEIGQLAQAIDKMELDIEKYIANVIRAEKDKRTINAELDVASKIQKGILPSVFPPYPSHKEFDIYASMNPAKTVGGDFYDFFLIDDSHLGMVIADVSGKGVPAALFMMISKVVIKNALMAGGSPAEVLEKTNNSLLKEASVDMFVTVWIGVLDFNKGTILAANAGHEYPVIARNGKFELLKDKHGFVVGGMEGVRYRNYEITLTKGDAVFVYTDGAPEAINTKEEQFGTGRMVEVLNMSETKDVYSACGNVLKAVQTFSKDTEQFDDITLMCMKYNGPQGNK